MGAGLADGRAISVGIALGSAWPWVCVGLIAALIDA